METKSLNRLAFLSYSFPLHSQRRAKKSEKWSRRGLTRNLVPVLGSRTLRTSRTRDATEEPTVPDLITIDLGTLAAVGSFAASAGLTCVRVFFRFDPLRRGIFPNTQSRKHCAESDLHFRREI